MEKLCFQILLFSLVTVNFTLSQLEFATFALFSPGNYQDINNVRCHEARNAEYFKHNHQKVNGRFNTNTKLCMKNVSNPGELTNELLPFASNKTIRLNYYLNKQSSIEINPKKTFIVTQISFQLTRLASAILIPLDVPLVAVTFQPMYPPLFSFTIHFSCTVLKQALVKSFTKEQFTDCLELWMSLIMESSIYIMVN